AAAMHVALLALLLIGVHFTPKIQPPSVIEAVVIGKNAGAKRLQSQPNPKVSAEDTVKSTEPPPEPTPTPPSPPEPKPDPEIEQERQIVEQKRVEAERQEL